MEKWVIACIHWIKSTKFNQQSGKLEVCIFWKPRCVSAYVKDGIHQGFGLLYVCFKCINKLEQLYIFTQCLATLPCLSFVLLDYMMQFHCFQGAQTWPNSDPRRQCGSVCLCPGACWVLDRARQLSVWLVARFSVVITLSHSLFWGLNHHLEKLFC